MPYLLDPRRTVTLNLHPAEYAALAEDALQAGYATPGTYAKNLVENRGDAPDPIQDQRSQERVDILVAGNAWLHHQFTTALRQLDEAGLSFSFPDLPPGEYRPRSRAAQDRAIQRAVKEALQQERATRRARVAARKAALVAAAPPTPPLPPAPLPSSPRPTAPAAAHPAARCFPTKPRK